MSTYDNESFIILGSSPPESIKPAVESSFSSSVSSKGEQRASSVEDVMRENVLLRDMLRNNNAVQRNKLSVLDALHQQVERTQQQHKQHFYNTKLLIQQLRTENADLHQQLHAAQVSEEGRSLLSAEEASELARLRAESEEAQVQRLQLQLYREDFEVERACRSRLAGEKEEAETSLRHALAHNMTLMHQLELVRELEPALYARVTSHQVYVCPKCECLCPNLERLQAHVDACVQ